ncbi:alpha/beta fold hydrolase [Aquihabitans sp. G128]|uniref:alpha/beta fold hydrolase n=1 Tax=Aquihabitans sp. G128 TaxID=2849779 RepID=UPI001C20FF03|nr:alpha/beta fold hydrolase [Aquihabitans sp. G128]QXC59145.1 alpha/beta fold hydrolase [Aquihabitans sp. G128]
MARRRRNELSIDTSTRFVEIHGHQRAYRIAGRGPALLLLHGIGDSSASWVPLMRPLAEHFTVIAPDLLGHGESAKPRADYSVAAYANGMRDLLDVLGIDKATVVGHSLGGGVAAQLAYQHPTRVERLALVASGGVAKEVSPFLRLASTPLADVFLPLLRLPPARLAAMAGIEVLRRSGTDIGRDAEELGRVLDALPDVATRGAFSRTLRSVVDWRGQVVTMLDRSYLTEAMPVLLVWGAHDAVIPVGHGHIAHAAMPGSELVVFDEAGHFPHHHDPDRFIDLLGAFIAGTDPVRFDRNRWRRLLREGRPRPSASAGDEGLAPRHLEVVPDPAPATAV